LKLDRRLGAGVAESLYVDPISDKDEQLHEAETQVLARDRQVQPAEAQKAQAEAELARIKSSRSLAACVPAWPAERSRCEVNALGAGPSAQAG
jgi:hypothetical protein